MAQARISGGSSPAEMGARIWHALNSCDGRRVNSFLRLVVHIEQVQIHHGDRAHIRGAMVFVDLC